MTLLSFLSAFFGSMWAWCEFRNLQIRRDLSSARLDLKLNSEILNVSTETMRKQTDQIRDLRRALLDNGLEDLI